MSTLYGKRRLNLPCPAIRRLRTKIFKDPSITHEEYIAFSGLSLIHACMERKEARSKSEGSESKATASRQDGCYFSSPFLRPGDSKKYDTRKETPSANDYGHQMNSACWYDQISLIGCYGRHAETADRMLAGS